jgi:hypothetical protein
MEFIIIIIIIIINFQHTTMPSPRKAFANKLDANRMRNGQLSNE